MFVDQDSPHPRTDPRLAFDDGRTRIETLDLIETDLDGSPADLLLVSLRSDVLAPRQVAVLRARTANESFARLALAEGWSPEWFIGVCDGCGGFGGNHRCENVLGADYSIPMRLGCRYWVTDHLPGGDGPCSREGGRDDLINGHAVRSLDPRSEAQLRQLTFLSTGWRSMLPNELRLYGGARVFEIEKSDQEKRSKALGTGLRVCGPRRGDEPSDGPLKGSRSPVQEAA